MAKFCTKCGKKLEEGQVCDCKKGEVKVENKGINVDFNKMLNDCIGIVKGIFIKPVDTIKEYSKDSNVLLGVIAIVINCLLSGVAFYFIMDKAFGGLLSLFTGGYGSLLSGSYSLPFGRIFFMGFLCMLAWFTVCGFTILLISNPILKDKIDVKKTFALVGVCSIFTTLTTVVVLILTFISVKFALIILLLGSGFYLTHLYEGISELTSIDKNKLVYVFVPAVALATFVMIEFIPRLFS